MHKHLMPILKPPCILLVLAALIVFSALPSPAMAQQSSAPASAAAPVVPQIIQFNGQFGDASGGSATVPSGPLSVTFTLYENEQGGSALWSETDNVQVDSQGRYSALLGSNSPSGLPLNLFTTGQAHWLSIQPLNTGSAEQPRVLLVSAPYALKARDAETIGGLPPSAFVRTEASYANSGASSILSGAAAGAVPAAAEATPFLSPSTPANYNVTVGYQVNGFYVVSTPGSTTTPNTALGVDVLAKLTSGTANTGSGFAALFNTSSGASNTADGWGAMNFNTSGNANTAVGVLALYNNTSGSFNVGIGTSALYTNTIGSNDMAIGRQSQYLNVSGSNNTALGYYSLHNNTVSNQTALGYQALYSNTTGTNETAAGYQALYSNTTGADNTATGYDALYANTTGSYNAAAGDYALYTNTTGGADSAFGYGGLFFNTTGTNNAANGNDALYYNTTGSQNTAGGVEALQNNTTGSNNLGLGYRAGYSVAAGNSNNIEIGAQGVSADNATIRIGTSGIQTSFFAAGITGVGVSGVPVQVTSSGQLGVALSSRRFKEDIHDMGDSSDALMRLRPVTFRYKQAAEDGSKPLQYGLIAEEVAGVYPDLVAYSADGQIETVKYQLLDPLLLNEVQRQHARILEEHALVLRQQSQIKAQQAQISELAAQMKIVQASLRSRRKAARPALASVPAQPDFHHPVPGQGSAFPVSTTR